jgi:MFS family permease
MRSVSGWVVGYGASMLADQVFFLALTWAALQVGTPSEVGLVLAAGSIPRLLILLVGGTFADAKSPKRIIIGADGGRALVMAAAGVALTIGSMNISGLVVVALAVGALDGLFLPAVAALPVRIAPPHLMGRVSAMRTVAQRVGVFGGGPLAGWLIYMYGPSAAFYGSAALFAISVGSLALVTVTPQPERADGDGDSSTPASAGQMPPARRRVLAAMRRIAARTAEGLHTVRHDPVLRWLLILIGGMNFGFAGPFTAGIPLLAAANGWGAHGAGLLIGAFGIGAAASGIALLFVKRVPRAGVVQLVGVLFMGLALAGVGTAATLPAAMAFALIVGLSSGLFGTVVYGLLLTAAPKAEVARVMALLALTLDGVAPISFLATGALSAAFGARWPFLIGGLIIVAATAAAATRPQLRALQLAEPEPPSTDPAAPA